MRGITKITILYVHFTLLLAPTDNWYLLLPEHSWIVILGDRGDMAVVGQGVERVDVPVSKPVDVEYDDVNSSSTDGLPFRKSLREKRRRHTERSYIPQT